MRSRTRRRSTSSWVSPGPRVPTPPPPSRDKWVQARVRRGSRYSSCASSTCSLPSRLRARGGEDVEDQLAAVEHLDVEALGQRALLARAQVLVEEDDASRRVALTVSFSSSTLPLPM